MQPSALKQRAAAQEASAQEASAQEASAQEASAQEAAAQEAADQRAADQRAEEREQQRQRDAAQRKTFAEWQRARQACKRVEEKRRWEAYLRRRAQERAEATRGRQRSAGSGSQSRRTTSDRTTGAKGASFNAASTTPEERDAHYRAVLALDAEALTPEAVRESYRRLAAGYHPDKVAHLGEKLQELAAAETRRLNEARAYFRRRLDF